MGRNETRFVKFDAPEEAIELIPGPCHSEAERGICRLPAAAMLQTEEQIPPRLTPFRNDKGWIGRAGLVRQGWSRRSRFLRQIPPASRALASSLRRELWLGRDFRQSLPA